MDEATEQLLGLIEHCDNNGYLKHLRFTDSFGISWDTAFVLIACGERERLLQHSHRNGFILQSHRHGFIAERFWILMLVHIVRDVVEDTDNGASDRSQEHSASAFLSKATTCRTPAT